MEDGVFFAAASSALHRTSIMQREQLAGSNSIRIRAHNQRALLLRLLQQGPLSRSQLAAQTGLSATTITNQTATLLDRGILADIEPPADDPETKRRGGRPRRQLRIVPEAGAVAGIHLGIGRMRVALHDLFGAVQAQTTASFSPDRPAGDVLNLAADLVQKLIDKHPGTRERLLGGGIGVPGLVDPQQGTGRYAIGLPWQDVPVAAPLAARLGVPVHVENNVRAMGLGEAMFGQGRGADLQVFIYGRTGVGAGIVRHGRIFRGSGGGAGEIGHMIVQPQNGRRCRCGQIGCLETVLSAPALLAAAAALGFQPQNRLLPDITELFRAAQSGSGSEQLAALLQDRGRQLGIALANLVNLLNPNLIVLGGLFAQSGDLLLPTIRATVRETAFAGLGRAVEIRPTRFGANAGVIGAAALALASEFYRSRP